MVDVERRGASSGGLVPQIEAMMMMMKKKRSEDDPDRLLSLKRPLTTPRQVLRQQRGGQRRVRRADVPQRRPAVARIMMMPE